MKSIAAAIATLALLSAPALAAPAADDFAPFWRAFQAAQAKDDQTALARMVKLGQEFADYIKPLTFASFHAQIFTRKVRACLAKTKAVRSVDGNGVVNYAAFCGQVIYVFYRETDGWKLESLSPDD